MLSDQPNLVQARSIGRGFTLSLGTYGDRLALLPILSMAAVLGFFRLSQEGYGNTYYAAAVRSMTQNWHAFLFNSLDPAGFVTLDKPPLGFWLQVASVKLFGFTGVALMLPQVLAGVCSVALLYGLVARVFGRPAGLIAALALTVTPINVVANRNNIVDSTLVLAVLLGAWAVTRAVETGKLRWLVLCAIFVGLGFNIKMLQAYLVLPAFGLMYLAGARIPWRKRLLHLVAATLVLLTVSLSWVTVVDLTPASQRPWVGSTSTNSALDLAIGYNGLQRLTGNTARRNRPGGFNRAVGAPRGVTSSPGTGVFPQGGPGGAGGGPGGSGENGSTGPLRLLNAQLGPQVSWLLPMAVLGLVAALEQAFRRGWYRDHRGAGLVMWGTWLLTTAVFFSIAGFFHTYYLVMAAPAISALAGIGIVSLWQIYRQANGRLWWMLPLSLGVVAAVQIHFLALYPDWSRWLTPLIAGGYILAAVILTLGRFLSHISTRLVLPALMLAVAALLAAPATWSVTSVQAANSGIIPRAGPAGTGSFGGPGGFFSQRTSGFRPPSGAFVPPPAGFRAQNDGSMPPSGMPGILAGGSDYGRVDQHLLRYLEQHQGRATYLLATANASAAEPFIIATGRPVMAMGGFSGSDPILTPARLATLVKQGVVRYFLLGGRGGPGGPGEGSSASSWVQQHCTVVSPSVYSSSTAVTVTGDFGGGQQLYNCTGAP